MPVSDPVKLKQIDIVKNDIEIIKQEIDILKTQLKKINSIQKDKVNETKGGWWWGY
tara:strand:+ start:487 stop:654 length:168 start_codon:yes stop_codon:yes gene_type:complete